LLGYYAVRVCLGSILKMAFEKRKKKIFIKLGLGVVIISFVVRFINIYGDSSY
jgi:hypothetical protein